MVDLNSVPNAPLKIIFLIHFILICLGLGKWCPLSYFFYNALFFTVLFWSMQNKDSEEPVQMAVAVNAASIILDIFVLALYFPEYYRDGSDRFSAGMAVLNLLIRPVTLLILYRLYGERVNASGGSVPPIFGIGVPQRSPYQDIDVMVHQSVPRTEVPSPSPFSPVHKMPPPDNQMPPPYQS